MNYISDFAECALKNFDEVIREPEVYLSCNESASKILKDLLKETYDFTKNQESKLLRSNALPELIVSNFDLEQIWQQVELQNEEFLNTATDYVNNLKENRNDIIFNELQTGGANNVDDSETDSSEMSDTPNIEEHEDVEDNMSQKSADLSSESEVLESNNSKNESNVKSSAVDDAFFKLNEMDNFCKAVENEQQNRNEKGSADGSDSEESINLFEGGSENTDEEVEDNLKNPKYADFFGDASKTRKLNYNESGSDVESDVEESLELKSTHELREERLKRKIESLEEIAIREKPWQLKGEVTAEARPQNSLLEEVVEFDMTSRPAPVITEETTRVLEDVIRQRIKDKAFDSVERRFKPVNDPLEYKKKLTLDHEKSKQSLAAIYEKEFLKQKEALEPGAADKETEVPKLHTEIQSHMRKLFAKLDALSNFYFTPKPVRPEVKIVSNLPAISMEEVAPVAVSDAALLAPEEVKSKSKGDVIGINERTKTDKKRERRKKKIKQREHAKEKRSKGNKDGGLLKALVKHQNIKKMEDSATRNTVKSSTAFFRQLQENDSTRISKKNKPAVKQYNAKKIKL